MASRYKDLDLFGSGPHRFRERGRGQTLATELSLDVPTNGTRYLGALEPIVEVTGRLAADDEAGLIALVDAVRAQLLDPPAPGALEDHHGRRWTSMSFVTFEQGDRIDRGRRVTLAYRAVFIDFKVYPQGDGDARGGG